MENGITVFEVETWDELKLLFDDNFSSNKHLVFRGQRDKNWSLEPTLTRLLQDDKKYNIEPRNIQAVINNHLDTFRQKITGRRGFNPPHLLDDDLWALGQHHGLATPLLDWTRSPYAAVFFAFRELDNNSDRAVWALNQYTLEIGSNSLSDILKEHPELSVNNLDLERGLIEVIEPNNDENTRLISQSGLFTKIPFGTKLEEWASKIMKNGLHKIIIPNSERSKILRSLDLMNINESTLFPDVSGSAQHTNYLLEVHAYGSKNSPYFGNQLIHTSIDLENLPD